MIKKVFFLSVCAYNGAGQVMTHYDYTLLLYFKKISFNFKHFKLPNVFGNTLAYTKLMLMVNGVTYNKQYTVSVTLFF